MTGLQPGVVLAPYLLGPIEGGTRAARRTAPARLLLGKPGRCPDQPTLLIKCFDNSGSIQGGNDPSGNRYVEAKAAVDRVARACRCGDELLAVVHFDAPTSADLSPTPIDRKHRAEIEGSLLVPQDGAGISELGPSLEAAYRLAERYPDHDAVLAVYSDFELFDTGLSAVLDRFAAFPGIVHAVVLRSLPPSRLIDDDRVKVTHVGYDADPGAVARAVFDSLTIHRPSRHVHGRR
jgi:hypothetical protein